MQIIHEGKELVLEEVAIQEATEKWSELLLADGTRLRIKPVVTKVNRAVGLYDATGLPVYTVEAQQVAVVSSSPDSAKRP